MSVEADHDPTSTRSWPSVASEVAASIAADVREWWRHPKRTAVAATCQLAWIMVVDVAICFGLGELWFRCWYSPADLSADQLGFARKREPGDQAAWWDDDQRFYHRNTFRALQTQWVWRECPLSLIACVVVTYLCTKIWPRPLLKGAPSLGSISLIVRSLQARLYGFGRQLVYTTRTVLLAPPDHLVRNFNDRKPRWRLRWTLRCWPGIAVHYVIRTVRRLPNPRLHGRYMDMTEHRTWYTLHFQLPRPCWISRKLRRGSFTLATVLRPLRLGPSQAEPNTVTEPSAAAMIYKIDRGGLVELELLELEKDTMRVDLENCEWDKAQAERDRSERDQTIRTLDRGLKRCQEERDDAERQLRNREEMLTLSVEKRTDLMKWTSRMIQNTGEHVTRLLSSITTHDLSTISDFLRAQDEAIKQRDGDSEPDLATCCASIMAEPAMLTLCASILAGLQAEKEYLEDVNEALFSRVLSLRRTLFAFRKRAWTVAIVRGVGDMMAGQKPPPLTDFFSIEKGDDTHLVCGSVANIPASPSTSFKSYVVDDVFIARKNTQIGEVLTPLIRRAYGKHDVCFIADGQSGSGKSYTLFNGPNALAPLIGKDILTREPRYEYSVTCTALEVCQDGLKDLLGAEGSPTTGLLESQSPRGKKPRALVNPLSKLITSEAQLCSLLTQACQRRRVSATGANAVSSRGHMICTLTIESGILASSELSRVVIVDLAGSERRQNESLKDDEKAETKFINNSRTEVRRALISLANNEIPTKDSMLTKALGSVLHKGSKFIMLAHLSPFARDHGRSVDTLNFCTEVSNRKSDLSPKEAERWTQSEPWYN